MILFVGLGFFFFRFNFVFLYSFFPPNKIFISLFLHIHFSGALRPIMPLFCPFSLQNINLEKQMFCLENNETNQS